MNEPNGWHNHERVYIQARDGDLVLVQYLDRHPLHWNGSKKLAPPIPPWGWVAQDDVMPFSDLDSALLKVWKLV